MELHAGSADEDIDVQRRASIEPHHSTPRLLHAGHFHTRPGYRTIRRRGTQDWLLFYTLAGSGRTVHRGGPLLTQRGDCVILPPGLPHDYRIALGCSVWEFLWSHFLPWPHWLGLLSWPAVYPGIKYLRVGDQDVHQRVVSALERMCDFRRGPFKQRELFAMNSLEEALLWLNSLNRDITEGQFDARIRRAMNYICQHASDRLTLRDIAADCCLSQSRLSHLFRRQLGVTPVQYIEQQRMRRARELLELSSFSITEIADMAGYASPTYFSRRFTALVGTAPRTYRREMQSGPKGG